MPNSEVRAYKQIEEVAEKAGLEQNKAIAIYNEILEKIDKVKNNHKQMKHP